MSSKRNGEQAPVEDSARHRCGIIMPISAMGSYTVGHWSDVFAIISDAISDANFSPNLVSNSDSVSVIHKTIVQNLYECPMVVCDVSGKNPNVMFELGLRLAFDKPTIVIKDNETTYSFDTSPIEHLDYPRDLRFGQIVDFKEKLRDKISHTFTTAQKDPQYSTFLKHFGQFTVPKIDPKEISGQEYIIEELKNIRKLVDRASFRSAPRRPYSSIRKDFIDICMATVSRDIVKDAADYMRKCKGVKSVEIEERTPDHHHILARGEEGIDLASIKRDVVSKFRDELLD